MKDFNALTNKELFTVITGGQGIVMQARLRSLIRGYLQAHGYRSMAETGMDLRAIVEAACEA